MMSFLRLIRVVNLVIIIITQYLIKYTLFPSENSLSTTVFLLLVLATICIAAAGNSINDVYDVVADKINKPFAPIPSHRITKKKAIIISIVLAILGIGLGTYISFTVNTPRTSLLFIGLTFALWLYSKKLKAVSDDAIASIAHNLPFNDRLVVHTSGSVPMVHIHKRNRRGVLYPLQTFSKKKAVDFSKVPMCIEFGHKQDFTVLEHVVNALGSPLYKITSDQRKSMHLAAVFVNNFTNHIYRIGHEICDTNGVEFDILKPLIQETASKIETLTPYMAQTGPAKRGDEKTIEKHLELLENDMHKKIYSLLTQSIKNTYGK